MVACANWLGANRYEVFVWECEEDSINDCGSNSIARCKIEVDPSDIIGSVRDIMRLPEDCEIEVN